VDANIVLTWALLLVLVIQTTTVLVFALAVRKTWREVVSFVTPLAENQESPLGLVMDDMAQKMGHATAMEVKTTFMGKESGLKRGEQAVAGDMAVDLVADQYPLLAGVLDGFPTLKKRLLKNPGLIGAALSVLGGKNNGGPAPVGGGGGGSIDIQSAFKL